MTRLIVELERDLFRALICTLCVWRSPSPNGHQGGSQRREDREFVLASLGGFGERLDQLQSLLKEFDGLAMCAARQSLLRGVTEITYGARCVLSFHKMHRQFRGQLVRLNAVTRFQSLADSEV